MILEEKRPAGKKRTIKSVTDDLLNGAWNNLDLSKKSKAAIFNAGAIILLGGAAAAYIVLKKK
jgi:hypothetical protein